MNLYSNLIIIQNLSTHFPDFFLNAKLLTETGHIYGHYQP